MFDVRKIHFDYAKMYTHKVQKVCSSMIMSSVLTRLIYFTLVCTF